MSHLVKIHIFFASMIYAVADENGHEVKWEPKVITCLEAYERLNRNQKLAGECILIPAAYDFDDEKVRVFKFALCKNDALLLQAKDGEHVLYRVQKLSRGEIQLCPDLSATIQRTSQTKWNRINQVDNLRKWNCRPVFVSATGRIRKI